MSKWFNTDDFLMELCKYCDSRLVMCDECPMKETINAIPWAWRDVNNKLPAVGEMVLVPLINKEIPYTEIMICEYKGEWEGKHQFRHFGFRGIKDFVDITHWMPLPDAPGVEDEQ